MRTFAFVALLAGLGAAATPAAAQAISDTPTYGSVRLKGGFLPDPHEVELTAGGAIEVDEAGCDYGFVATSPDIDFYYEGNGTRTLYIYASSDEDTMLLINAPDGTWFCDDDGFELLDPLVVFANAGSGLYNIWVGTYGDATASATLKISELDPR